MTRGTPVLRRLLVLVAIVLDILGAVPRSDAQPSAGVARIGYLTATSQPAREEVDLPRFRRHLG